MDVSVTTEGGSMSRPETSTALKMWAKPAVRRMAGGSAELNSSTSVDGSGTFS